MSHDDAAAAAGAAVANGADRQGDEDDDTFCPICLEPFPMLTWRGSGRTRYLCCGKTICDPCEKNGMVSSYLHKAVQEGVRRGVPLTSDHLRKIHEEEGGCPFCRSPVVVSDSERVRQAQALADRGTPWALMMLGSFHEGGIGTEQNMALAVECYRKAAEMGYTQAQHQLGECYLFGVGTAVDVDAAAKWYGLSAGAGFAEAQRRLGNILGGYAGRSSVPIDHERAFELYAASAGQGYGPAQSDLATAYASGFGVPPSFELSTFWGRRAAMQGIVDAQRNLAGTYFIQAAASEGVPVTAPIALFWARKAAAAGDVLAIPLLRQMERLMATQCGFCNAPASGLPSRLLRCSRCKEGLYCCGEHQKRNWKAHKRWCEEVKAAREEYEQAQKESLVSEHAAFYKILRSALGEAGQG